MIVRENYELELKYISKVSLYFAREKFSPQGDVVVFPLFMTGICLNLIQLKIVWSLYCSKSSHSEEGTRIVQDGQ